MNDSKNNIKKLKEAIKHDIVHTWFNNIKKNKKFFLSDSTGVNIKARKVLTGVILMQEFLKKKIPQKENNIATIIPTSVAGSLVNIALLNLGKTVCHLNYTSDLNSLDNSIKISNANTLITSKKFISILNDKGFNLSNSIAKLNIVYLEDLKTYANTFKKIKYYLLTFIHVSILKWLFAQKNQPDKTAFILFSSGSENTPKGIRLSHKNIVGNVIQSSYMLNIQNNDVLIGTLPIFHSFGLTVCAILPQLIGISAVYHPDPTDGVTISELVSKYKGTMLFATPTFLRLYTKNQKINPQLFQNLNKVIVGAEKLPENTKKEFQERFNVNVYEGYGTTETSPVISCNSPNNEQIQNKASTVGRPLIGTKVIIVDPKTYKELDIDQEGLVMVSGIQVMQGYLGDNLKTQNVLKTINDAIFYNTGDRGKMDKDGFLTIIDRYARFVKIAGEMMSLSKLEFEICKHVKDIEVCATSLYDDKKGEKIILLHTGDINIKKLKQELLGSINPLFIPNNFIQVNEIPKLGSGKVNFSKVKQIAKDNLIR